MLTKVVLGESYPAEAFLHVPDPENPETWDVLCWESVLAEMTPKSMHRAAMTLRANKGMAPGDREAAIRKLHGKYMERGVRKRDLPAAMQAGMAYAATRRKMRNASKVKESLKLAGVSQGVMQEWDEDDEFLAENPLSDSLIESGFGSVEIPDEQIESLQESRESEIREAYIPTGLREARLDRANRIIHNTVVITRESANGPHGKRRYSDKALRNISKMAEGIEAYLNHAPRDQAFQARQVQELAGRHINVRFDEQNHRVTSDFKVLGPQAEMVFALAEDMPDIVGNSVVSRGVVRLDGDTEIVDDILEVRSVDLVSSPGATRGLFEHLETWRANHPQGDQIMEVTLEKILEALDKSGAMATAVKEHLVGKELKALTEAKDALSADKVKGETEMIAVRKELEEAKVKLEQYAAAEAITAKKARLAEAIEKSDLGAGKAFAGYASEKFQGALLSLEEAKWEEHLGDLVESLKKAAGAVSAPRSEGKNPADLQETVETVIPEGSHARLAKLLAG
jgi:hypothetical protein